MMNILKIVIKKIKGKFLKNTGWLLFEQIFRMILSLAVTTLMARYLGTHNYGLISYGAAYIAIFTTISQLGIGEILVNEIIKNRDKTGIIIGTTIILRLFSALLSIILIYIVVAYLNPNNFVLQIITFIQSISLLFIAFDAVGYWFQSNLQSKYAVIAKSIAFTLVSIWRIVLIYVEASVQYFAVATILQTLAISTLIILFYFKFKGPRFNFSLDLAKNLLSKSYPFIISGLFVTVYTQMDKIMLGQLTNESSVGVYTVAMTISGLWIFIPNSLIESARPIIMAAKGNDEERYIKRLKQLFSAIIWISILASLVITVLSENIILILFGNQYIEAIGILTILIWSKIFSLIGVTRTIWLITENKVKYHIYFLGIGAAINVVLNLILIPMYGAIGAAIATILAEFISNTLSLIIFKETRPLFKLIIESFMLKGIRN
jgi:O-antigen/teichoic acid export membrane protein